MSEQWEYKIIQAKVKGMGMIVKPGEMRQSTVDVLNQHGRDGWEAYHVKTDDFPETIYLKRRL